MTMTTQKNIKVELNKSFGVVPVFLDDTGKPHFLLLQHRALHWGFPKGHAKEGETPQEAAQREFTEETGIKECSLEEKTFVAEFYLDDLYGRAPKNNADKIHRIITYHIGQVADTHVALNKATNEILDYVWLPYETAYKKLTFPEAKHVLTQIFQHITNTKL